MKRLDYTIEDIKKYCSSKGGECLEEQYKGNKYKYKCICDQKHIFYLNWYTATRISSWCPICKGVMLIADEEIKKIHDYCISKKGKCLEEEYKGTNKRYKTVCDQGHIFYLKWSMAKMGGTVWCPTCAGKINPEEGMADINKFCKSKKGYCLDQEYKGTHHKYNCVCHLGHEFEIFWKDSKRKGTWCPWCYKKRNPEEQLEKLRKYCESKNGKLLSEKYTGASNKYKCECELKHIFETRFCHLLFGKCWCPICAQDNTLVGENLTKEIFESIFNKEFKKVFHEKLINPETNRKLQLDGYCEELSIAFEYNGYQHYIFPNHFHKTKDRFLNRIKVDKIKRKLCEENNIVLIEVRGYEGEAVNKDKLEKQIVDILKDKELI